jgi:hypothetical protein
MGFEGRRVPLEKFMGHKYVPLMHLARVVEEHK